MARRPRRRRRLLFVMVLLGGAAAWYARSRLTGTREPWSSVPMPGQPVAPGEFSPPALSPVSASWADGTRPPSPTVRAETTARSLFEPADAASNAAGAAPGPEYTIKGNADSMLFHPPTSPYYKRTKAEVWFRDADEARAAGFTEWTPKKRADR